MLFEQKLAADDLVYPPDGVDPSEAVRAEDAYPDRSELYRHMVLKRIADLNEYAQEPTTAPFQLRNKINAILEALDLEEHYSTPEEEIEHPQPGEAGPFPSEPSDAEGRL